MRSKPKKICRIPIYKQKKLRQMRSFLYKGTRITINKHYRYEWKITILRSSMINIVKQKTIYDYTSRISKQFTIEDAKSTVDAILTPFFYELTIK